MVLKAARAVSFQVSVWERGHAGIASGWHREEGIGDKNSLGQ